MPMKEHKGLYSILKYFKIEKGMLLIGGRNVEDIAAEVGTPFYSYDLQVARKKFERLRAALPQEIEIHYAIKANPHPQILRFFQDLGAGFDVASVGELNIAMEAGADPKSVGFAGPGKRQEEIELACETGIGSLNVENEAELELANQVATHRNETLRVSLRINPAFQLVGSGMKMGGVASQFGIDHKKIPDVLQRFHEWPHLDFVGFHIFSGSQNLIAESISSSFKNTLDTVISLIPYCPRRPTQLNLGGGFVNRLESLLKTDNNI
jgi:diaminopimelate decarboxylase